MPLLQTRTLGLRKIMKIAQNHTTATGRAGILRGTWHIWMLTVLGKCDKGGTRALPVSCSQSVSHYSQVKFLSLFKGSSRLSPAGRVPHFPSPHPFSAPTVSSYYRVHKKNQVSSFSTWVAFLCQDGELLSGPDVAFMLLLPDHSWPWSMLLKKLSDQDR